MSRDNLPTVQLQTWELNANLYDGTSTAGPVPTIFSDDQQATIDALVGDPAQAHKDVMKINRYKQLYVFKNWNSDPYSLQKPSNYIFFFPTQYFRDAWSDQSCSLRKHHQKTEVIILPRKWFKFPKLLATINTNCSLDFREGTGIQKFKRGRWSTSDESPPKKKKVDTDSGTAHFA